MTIVRTNPFSGFHVTLKQPSMEDQTSDWARLKTALLLETGLRRSIDLPAYSTKTTGCAAGGGLEGIPGFIY